jgi:protein TonB
MARLQLAYFAAAVATVTIHVVAFGGLNAMKKPEPEKRTVAVMVSAPKPKAKPPEPPKPIQAPKEMLQRPTLARPAAAPPPVAPPPEPVAAAHPQMAALPDFGISMTGGLPGAGGIAVPMGGAARPSDVQPKPKEKVLGVAAERPTAAGNCAEDLVKAKPQGFVKPTYTDDARAAGIEGRVRVEISIDETGHVASAKIVAGLGHGLDESAIDAAKRLSFSPATLCGTAVKSTFVLSMRFVLGE